MPADDAFPPGRSRPSAVAVLLCLVALGFALGACSRAAAPLAPVSPSVIEHTPVANLPGVVASATPTVGPSVTPTWAPTEHVPPPEPLSAPPHFEVGLYADQVGPVRLMASSPSGDLFVSVPANDRIVVLPDRDRSGVADALHVFAEGGELNEPHGLAFHDAWLYVANTDSVVRYPYAAGDLQARGAPEQIATLPGGPQHWTRTIVVGPDERLYVSVGASCNVCAEQDVRRASILRFDLDGGSATRLASGLRNAVGLAFHPGTGELWATENGRDELGDDRPPDEINRIVRGGDYGWPICFGDREPDPAMGADRERCAATRPPAVLLQAHSAPLGLTFYMDDQFPEAYHGDMFVAYHGSWNRTIPTGYKIVRIAFEGGQPAAPPRDFVTGWLRPDTRRWGRPVDVHIAPDGALLVTDDAGERIYRVSHAPPPPTPTRLWER